MTDLGEGQFQYTIHETWGYLFHMNHICSIGNLFGIISSWQEAWGESTVTPCTSYPTYSHPYPTPASFLRVVSLPHQCNNIPFSVMQSSHLPLEFTLGFIYFRGFETAWWYASTAQRTVSKKVENLLALLIHPSLELTLTLLIFPLLLLLCNFQTHMTGITKHTAV